MVKHIKIAALVCLVAAMFTACDDCYAQIKEVQAAL